MTREEALDWIVARKEHYELDDSCQPLAEALNIAIKAMNRESILDKIRADIEETYTNITYQENKDRKATWGLRKALQIIDKYKAESESQERDET